MDENDLGFVIEGPDADGFVWMCSPKGRDVWCRNLGDQATVAEAFSQWLASVENGD